ncbi:MAG TPA: caspase family protein, partial [Thermoanaerobaculia bacterium]
MGMEPNQSPRYRAVLIGIDDYPQKPLDGCVNDIDQIERILLDRLGVPPERITRFAAPRAGAVSTTRLPSLSPERDGIRNFLNRLAEEATPDDLVFLYYSGHGSQVMTRLNGQVIAREALIPVDAWNHEPMRLLYDFELNGLLARIAERAGDLTLVLDCCHSASATREDIVSEVQDRYLPISGIQDLSPGIQSGLASRDSSGLLPPAPAHMLIASCRASERAYEVQAEGSKPPQGAFSRALVQILESTDKPLSGLLWSDIWTVLLDRIARSNSLQHPQLVGRWERSLFGGPWTPRDGGYVVRQKGDRFRIEAGTLVGLSEGAEVAVYGPEPDLFPALGSPEDSKARIGLLRVESADRSFCTAASANGSLNLPAAARGRLVNAGKPDRLTASVEPFDPDLVKRVEARNVVAVRTGQPEAEAFLRRDEKGWLHLGDQLHGDGRDPQRPPLVSFLDRSPVALERVLDHYARYVQVLRLPGRCRDLTEALRVELLDCRGMGTPSAGDLQAPDFPRLASGGPWTYQVRDGDGFAIRIE